MKRIVLVDRDGTIIREPRDKKVDSLEKLEFVPGIISGLKLLSSSGLTLLMVSNQDALGTKKFPKRLFARVQEKILSLLKGEGIRFEKIFICPHLPEQDCSCRKPNTGLIDEYLKKNTVDAKRSFVLGDRETDVRFAVNLGFRSVLVARRKTSRAEYTTDDAFDACNYIARAIRSAKLHRTTSETNVEVSVWLDGSGKYDIATGIGILDHMLAQLARHSRIDLTVRANGDLHVDEHHTVEDVGFVIGEALWNALGEKQGIERYGFVAPMDEATAQVVLDISGRAYLSFVCDFHRERIGGLPTELLQDFFQAFARGLRATLHIRCTGRNDHHKIEAIFKSTARALKAAIRVDPRAPFAFPSTKGLV